MAVKVQTTKRGDPHELRNIFLQHFGKPMPENHLSPKVLDNIRQGFSMLSRLVSNSLPQVIRLPWPPKVLGLQI
ncbi:Calcium-binding mitochondrial carrier protein Aralar1 [Plecturocebus cupreus]